MNEQQGDNDKAKDVADNEVGPTEQIREDGKSEGELSAPGSQNPDSEEIKEEKGPNSE